MKKTPANDKKKVKMAPLRPYEMPDTPAVALDIEPEPDEYAIPSEKITREEIRLLARPVTMDPLRPDEMPDSAVSVLKVKPDHRLDEPSWGTCGEPPEIVIGKGKLLHPWDDDPVEPAPRKK
jgi:hypothetical protein